MTFRGALAAPPVAQLPESGDLNGDQPRVELERIPSRSDWAEHISQRIERRRRSRGAR